MPHSVLDTNQVGGPYAPVLSLPYLISQLLNPVGEIRFGVGDWVDASATAPGTPLTLFVDADAELPGLSIVDTEAVGIRWNNKATLGEIQQAFALSFDFDTSKDVVMHYLLSKTGATQADAVTMQSTVAFVQPGDLHDADTPVVDVSDALVGDAAAKTVSHLTATIAAADIPDRNSISTPINCNLIVQPSDGTLGTDDLIMHACWMEYKRLPAQRVWDDTL